jgi:hypothetical protein
MEISEAASTAQEESQEQHGFQFIPLGDDAKVFPNFKHKDT